MNKCGQRLSLQLSAANQWIIKPSCDIFYFYCRVIFTEGGKRLQSMRKSLIDSFLSYVGGIPPFTIIRMKLLNVLRFCKSFSFLMKD